MKLRTGAIIALGLMVAIVTSCKKTINYTASSTYSGSLTDFFIPLEIGKYAIYRLDSLNFYYYGQLDTITSYLAKDSVENTYTDGAGNQAWFVTRYLSDTLNDNGWTPNETYTVTPSVQNIQLDEENLRFIKLAWPISLGFTWPGNTYLPDNPYQDFFQFSDATHITLNDWTYAYTQVDQPYTADTLAFDSTLTVLQANDSINVPIVNPNAFASRTYWVETYAKHIGLVYRQTQMWEYQPPTPDGSQAGYKIGFEMTMTMLSHN
jgi:hypothetical protein